MTSNLLGVDDKRVLVTGAAGGIGRALAQGFAQAGASVILLDRYEAAVIKVAATLKNEGLDVTGLALDVTDAVGIERALDAALSSTGRLDVLVNNAGVKSNQSVLKGRTDAWERTMDINARSVFTLSRLAIRRYMRSNGGSIINIGSSVSSRAAVLNYQAGGADYCLSKAIVHALTQLLAYEAAPHGITVNAIAPGIVDTPMHGRPLEVTEAKHISKIPMNRIGQPGDFVGPALFLASRGASYITGQILHVNGGMVMEP